MGLTSTLLLLFGCFLFWSVVESYRRGKWGPRKFDGLDRQENEWSEPPSDQADGRGGWLAGLLERLPKPRKSIKRIERDILDVFGPMDDGPGILRRTLASLRRQYPDKDEVWYYEKAYDDLRRDRRF